MLLRWGAVLAALIVVAIALPAAAQQFVGPYVSLGAGFGYTQQQSPRLDTTLGGVAQRQATKPVQFGGGFAVQGATGYAIGNGLRFELEGSYRRNGVDHVSGDEGKFGAFANALYDADIGVSWLYPFAGIGVGFQSTNWHNVTVRSSQGGASSVDKGTANQFAYQGIVGAGIPFPGVPNLSVTAEYHYARSVGSRTYSGITESAAPVPNRVHVGEDESHAMIVGFRYGFGPQQLPSQPDAQNFPPPLSGAIAPPARSYVVYFDPNSTVLSERARDVIAQAARASSRLAYTRIEVSGHTDITGAKASNVELSRLRAQAVADELVRWGIARSVIEIHAFGDERPAFVPQAGVSEPRNRRVEILYR